MEFKWTIHEGWSSHKHNVSYNIPLMKLAPFSPRCNTCFYIKTCYSSFLFASTNSQYRNTKRTWQVISLFIIIYILLTDKTAFQTFTLCLWNEDLYRILWKMLKTEGNIVNWLLHFLPSLIYLQRFIYNEYPVVLKILAEIFSLNFRTVAELGHGVATVKWQWKAYLQDMIIIDDYYMLTK